MQQNMQSEVIIDVIGVIALADVIGAIGMVNSISIPYQEPQNNFDVNLKVTVLGGSRARSAKKKIWI